MGTRSNPGAYDCYANAEPDEPMFVLLGRDRTAAALVNLWATMRLLDDEADRAKCDAATHTANDMVAFFQARKPDLTPAGMLTLAKGLTALADMVGASVSIRPKGKGHIVRVSHRPAAT